MSSSHVERVDQRTTQRSIKSKIIDHSEQERDRRAASMSILRKKKQEDKRLKRRRLLLGNSISTGRNGSEDSNFDDALGVDDRQIEEANSKIREYLENFQNDAFRQQMLTLLYDADVQENQLIGLVFFRHVLSAAEHPPIDEVLSLNNGTILEHVVQLFGKTDNAILRFEAAWFITNVASGTTQHCVELMNTGACDLLLKYAADQQSSIDLRDQCVWALGNIAADAHPFRQYCIERNIVPILVSQYTCSDTENDANTNSTVQDDALVPEMSMSLLNLVRNTTWALSNICRPLNSQLDGQGDMIGVNFDDMIPALPALGAVIRTSNDVETVLSALWGMARLSQTDVTVSSRLSIQTDENGGEMLEGVDAQLAMVLETECLMHAVKYMSAPNRQLRIPAQRLVGNITAGDHPFFTEEVIRLQPFDALVEAMQDKNVSIRKEAVWILSNIAAGTPEQIQSLIDYNVMPHVCQKLLNDSHDVKKEACWTLGNALCKCDDSQVRMIADTEVILGFTRILDKKSNDVQCTLVALEALERILRVVSNRQDQGIELERLIDVFHEQGTVEVLEQLQEHKSDEIYNLAMTIIEEYFSDDYADRQHAESINANTQENPFAAAIAAVGNGGATNFNQEFSTQTSYARQLEKERKNASNPLVSGSDGSLSRQQPPVFDF